jgi:hypothetical protein
MCPNLNISIMMSFLTYITGFLMNFELLPILTDYANLEVEITGQTLEGGHPRTIPPKVGCNWPSGF